MNVDVRKASSEDARAAEKRALPVALLMLLAAFGSIVAALLPVGRRHPRRRADDGRGRAARADVAPVDLRSEHRLDDRPGARHRLRPAAGQPLSRIARAQALPGPRRRGLRAAGGADAAALGAPGGHRVRGAADAVDRGLPLDRRGGDARDALHPAPGAHVSSRGPFAAGQGRRRRAPDAARPFPRRTRIRALAQVGQPRGAVALGGAHPRRRPGPAARAPGLAAEDRRRAGRLASLQPRVGARGAEARRHGPRQRHPGPARAARSSREHPDHDSRGVVRHAPAREDSGERSADRAGALDRQRRGARNHAHAAAGERARRTDLEGRAVRSLRGAAGDAVERPSEAAGRRGGARALAPGLGRGGVDGAPRHAPARGRPARGQRPVRRRKRPAFPVRSFCS